LNKSMWFKIMQEGNFYDDMTGKLIGETPRTYILEFNLSDELGGCQRVQFWKKHCIFDGEY